MDNKNIRGFFNLVKFAALGDRADFLRAYPNKDTDWPYLCNGMPVTFDSNVLTLNKNKHFTSSEAWETKDYLRYFATQNDKSTSIGQQVYKLEEALLLMNKESYAYWNKATDPSDEYMAKNEKFSEGRWREWVVYDGAVDIQSAAKAPKSVSFETVLLSDVNDELRARLGAAQDEIEALKAKVKDLNARNAHLLSDLDHGSQENHRLSGMLEKATAFIVAVKEATDGVDDVLEDVDPYQDDEDVDAF